jgi:hypothetical protein
VSRSRFGHAILYWLRDRRHIERDGLPFLQRGSSDDERKPLQSGLWFRPADRRQATFWPWRKNRRLAWRLLSASEEGSRDCPRRWQAIHMSCSPFSVRQFPQNELRGRFIIGSLTVKRPPQRTGAAGLKKNPGTMPGASAVVCLDNALWLRHLRPVQPRGLPPDRRAVGLRSRAGKPRRTATTW